VEDISMEVNEYGCNDCRSTFKKPYPENMKADKNVKCPNCHSGNVVKLDSTYDKLRFFTQFAWGGG
jgi:DNA-directed RNA polymerase subunit RPC12/RpoP